MEDRTYSTDDQLRTEILKGLDDLSAGRVSDTSIDDILNEIGLDPCDGHEDLKNAIRTGLDDANAGRFSDKTISDIANEVRRDFNAGKSG